MKTEFIEDEIIETDSADIKSLVAKYDLDADKAQVLIANFSDCAAIAAEWKSKAETIVVTSETQTDEMAQAREGRLLLARKRIDLDKARKRMKEQSLREGRAIDGICKSLIGLIEPIEDYLRKQENYVKEKQAAALKAIADSRIAELQKYGANSEEFSGLDIMSDATFKNVLFGVKQAYEERKAAEEAEAKERERIRQENEKLKAEAAVRDAALTKERAEREKLESAENDRRAKEIIAAAEKDREEAAKLAAPDREKIITFVDALAAVPVPPIADKKYNAIMNLAKIGVTSLVNNIKKQIGE